MHCFLCGTVPSAVFAQVRHSTFTLAVFSVLLISLFNLSLSLSHDRGTVIMHRWLAQRVGALDPLESSVDVRFNILGGTYICVGMSYRHI